MKLKIPLPPNKTYEQIENHYLTEKAIATKLKKSSREKRKQIYETMYDELFEKVPDHPRLTRRESIKDTLESNRIKFAIVEGYLDDSVIFLEFAPGDCKFAIEVSKKTAKVFAADLSNQHQTNEALPKNFEMLYYDGYNLNSIPKDSIDVAFSDQLIEHIHPEDTKLHYKLALKLLKDDGKYIFRMPHLQSGPHDISQFFSDVAEGFHLKEWTYRETVELLKDVGFSKLNFYWFGKDIRIRLPYLYFRLTETFLDILPRGIYKRKLGKYLIPSICIVAYK